MPKTLWCFTFASLALIGIPPASGFVSKWHLAQGALGAPVGILRYIGPAVLLVSALLTAGYLLPIVMNGFFPGTDFDEKKAENAELKEAPAGMLIPLMILAGLSLLLGIFPSPLTEFVSRIAETLM